MRIIIGSPYIKSTLDDNYLLCSDIEGIKELFTLWYEVDEKFKNYLCIERSDGFLIGILPYAMANSTDEDPITVICKAPVSEQLYYQLTVHYIPTLVKSTDRYHNIKIECQLDNLPLNSKNAIGTGVSGGVDSFYTLLKSKQLNSSGFQITHGTYFEYDPNGIFDGELQNKLRENAEKICSEYKLDFVNIKSNICKEIYRVAHESIITCMLLSYTYALQKLFSIYYFSSTYPYDEFRIVSYCSELYNLLNAHLLSTENIKIYITGSEAKRHEKETYIADYELPMKYLMICLSPKIINGELKNCSRCSKCTMTMINMDLEDKLYNFHNIFDVEAYNRNINYYWGYIPFKGKSDVFVRDTLSLIKSKKRKFPFSARVSGIKKYIKNGFKRGNPLRYDYRP